MLEFEATRREEKYKLPLCSCKYELVFEISQP